MLRCGIRRSLGWSNTAMAKNYQHMTGRIRRDIAKRVEVLLWGMPMAAQDDDDGASGALIPA